VYTTYPLTTYLDELASSNPVPGGGSAAALSGALAAALVSMVCNLTIGKKRFRTAEPELREVLQRSEDCRSRLTALVQKDTEVYACVMAAHRLPQDSEEDRQQRAAALQSALVQAAAVPMEIAKECCEAVRLSATAAELGNPWAITDAGAAALLGEAALRAAGLSVEINLRSMADQAEVQAWRHSLHLLESEAQTLCRRALDMVHSRMAAQ